MAASDYDFSRFRTDIVDQGNHYLLQAELPGFNKDEIRIDLTDNYLTIRAEHREEKEDKQDKYVRRERRYGSFSRGFDVTGIDTSSISAAYKNGVLELKLPKTTPSNESPTRQIDIQ